MYAGLVQVYQTCMLVGKILQNDMTAGYINATVKDMVNDMVQLLQTWMMVGCKCNIHGC